MCMVSWESGVGSQESGERSRESIVRSQESIVRSLKLRVFYFALQNYVLIRNILQTPDFRLQTSPSRLSTSDYFSEAAGKLFFAIIDLDNVSAQLDKVSFSASVRIASL